MKNNQKSYDECIGAIPSKTTYIPNNNSVKNEIYYFGKPPKKPDSLYNFIKNKKG